MKSACELIFGGHILTLDASGALWWEAAQLLVASDLHFEKATFLGQHGSLIAPYDTLDTMHRLEQQVRQYQPRILLLLGDSFHDRGAWERLTPALQERLLQLCTSVEHCYWIEGNHDRAVAVPPWLQYRPTYTHEGIHFSHDEISGDAPHIIGHYHPKTSVLLKNRHATGRCFLSSKQLLIMPAFGSYTGGLDANHPTFAEIFCHAPIQRHLLYQGAIYTLPL